MTHIGRTTIAAALTVAALAGLAGFALTSGSGTNALPTSSATPAPKVRTEVIRRTIHRKETAPPVSATTAPAPARATPARTAPVPLPSPVAPTSATVGDEGQAYEDDTFEDEDRGEADDDDDGDDHEVEHETEDD